MTLKKQKMHTDRRRNATVMRIGPSPLMAESVNFSTLSESVGFLGKRRRGAVEMGSRSSSSRFSCC